MADIEFKCPACTKSLTIDAKGAGKMIKCPDCGATVQVPGKPSSDVQFKCQHCGRALNAPSGKIGQACRCPDCKGISPVPGIVGKECPHCHNRVKASTSLCIKCGYNFITGRMPDSGSFQQPRPALNPKCPDCGAEVGLDDVLCVNCGLNLRTGRRVSGPIEDEQLTPAAQQPAIRSGMNGRLLGITAIVLLAVSGIAFIGWKMRSASPSSSWKEWVSPKIMNNKPSEAFKTSIVELLSLTGELVAQTEGGVARNEFSQSLAKVKSKTEIVFAIWPSSFLPDAKEELIKAIHGWDLALAMWMNDENIKVLNSSSALGQEIENYGVPMRGLAKSVIPHIFEVASRHYDKAKTQMLEVLSQ